MIARHFSVLVLFVSVALTACGKKGSASVPTDLADAVPTDAVVVLQIRSADELAKHGGEFQSLAMPGGPPTTGASLLSMMLAPIGPSADVAQVDTTRPMAVALRMDPASPMPIVTYVLPARDSKALAGAPSEGPIHSQVFGKYVAFSTGAIPASSARSRLLEGGTPGLVTARIDLAAIVGKYRPMIDMGLQQAEQMIDSGMISDPNSPIDPSEMVEVYLDFAREMLDSADILGISIELADPEASMSFVLENRAGSPLAKYALPEKVDYEELAGKLDPAATAQMLWSYKMGSMVERMWPMYESMFTAMGENSQVPPEFAKGFRAYMEQSRALMAQFGPVAATSFDLGPEGIRFAGYYEAPDPKALADGMRKLMVDPAVAGMGMVIEAPRDVEIAGNKGISTRVKPDLARMQALIQADRGEAAAPDPEAERAMAALIGPNGLELTLFPVSDGVVMVTGGDAAWQTSTAKRLVSGGKATAGLARAVDSIEGSNPAMAAQFDLARGLSSIAGMVRQLDPSGSAAEMESTLKKLGDKPLVASFHWGVKGTTWKSGFTIDRDGLRRLMAMAKE